MAESEVSVILEKIENLTSKMDELKADLKGNNTRMIEIDRTLIKHEAKISILWGVAVFSAIQFGYVVFSIIKGVVK